MIVPVTGDECDNFLLFISFLFFRAVMRRHMYICVYIENLVTLSRLSQNWMKIGAFENAREGGTT